MYSIAKLQRGKQFYATTEIECINLIFHQVQNYGTVRRRLPYDIAFITFSEPRVVYKMTNGTSYLKVQVADNN